MLILHEIVKDYFVGEQTIHALKGINVTFRNNEFVSILGPSGCGKTTLLNIIAGLDRYTTGDLIINERSTKSYHDHDWDSYRNHSIGVVFQSYNLIPHLNVLENVELALTLSGENIKIRKDKAIAVLKQVGLEDQMHKKPNQLSGGQMQRVAIARALVNNPEILLADEPTGALDSNTSRDVMEVLREVAKRRLVIMVTHNESLANTYSTRIINLLDGQIISDSTPFELNEHIPSLHNPTSKTAMSFLTALNLSFKNLLTKKGRTIITAIAGSIGIIGVALILAISNGVNKYMDDMQTSTLANYPIEISETYTDYNGIINDFSSGRNNNNTMVNFPDNDIIYPQKSQSSDYTQSNTLDDNYLEYIYQMDQSLYNSINCSYGVTINFMTSKNYTKVSSNNALNQLIGDEDFLLSQYDLLGNEARFPQNANEIVLIIDSYNRISANLLNACGFDGNQESFKFDDFLGIEFSVIYNNDFYYSYTSDDGRTLFATASVSEELYDKGEKLVVVGILRIKESSSSSSSLLRTGFGYTQTLTEKILASAHESEISVAQKVVFDAYKDNSSKLLYNVIGGQTILSTSISRYETSYGINTNPTSINIYPTNFKNKNTIKEYLHKWNIDKEKEDQVLFNDLAEIVTASIGTTVNIISIVLICFAGISLLVSSIMIGIITWVSVIERTKEIGVLRAIGARKKDITRVFIAETALIGLFAGLFGVMISFILCFPINAIINHFQAGIGSIAALPLLSAAILIAISIALTIVAGLIPSLKAAKKDPVVALRTE